MARYTVNLVTGTTGLTTGVLICSIQRPRAFYEWFAVLGAYGTFGSGTLTWYLSVDGGVSNLMALKDITDTAISFTTNSAVSLPLPGHTGSNLIPPMQLYVKLAGSTSPNLNVFVEDNR